MRATVRWSSVSSPTSGRKGFGRSGRLSGHSLVPPPPARMTTYIPGSVLAGSRPERVGVDEQRRRLERRRRGAEQDDRATRPRIAVAMGLPRRVGDGVAGLEDVVLVADPELEAAFQDDDDLLVGAVGIRLVPGPTARLDRRQDHLE